MAICDGRRPNTVKPAFSAIPDAIQEEPGLKLF